MSLILYSLKTVGPVFLIIGIGAFLRYRTTLLTPEIAGRMSRIVFYLFLPALLLKALISADFSKLLSWKLLLTVWGILFISIILARIIAVAAGFEREDRGVFTAGSYWGNVVMVGYALGEALYGEAGLARAAVFSVMVLVVHSPVGTLLMVRGSEDHSPGEYLPAMLRRIFTNPIIITIILGLVLNLGLGAASLSMPAFLLDILELLSRASLPLALVAIGGSLEFGRQGAGWKMPGLAAGVKLLLMPLIAIGVTSMLNLDPGWRGSVIIGFACPTAVSYFVVSTSMGHEAFKGAAIVTATTVGAALTVGVLAIVLRAAGLA